MRTFLQSILIPVALAALALPVQAMDMGTTPDPFDYSYCGGRPVYPVIGFNFATACGGRNQIGLGRRGRLMWLFTTVDNRVHASGNRNLTEEEAGGLLLLAEAAQLAARPLPASGPVRYDLGINFTGRPEKYAHGVLFANTDSVQALFDAMQRLVPDQPLLPECPGALLDFSPTMLPHERRTDSERGR